MKKYSFDRNSKFKIEFLYILEFEKNNDYCSYEMRIFSDKGNDAEEGVTEYIESISKIEDIGEDYNYRLADCFEKIIS
jgi:hypothetical protein